MNRYRDAVGTNAQRTGVAGRRVTGPLRRTTKVRAQGWSVLKRSLLSFYGSPQFENEPASPDRPFGGWSGEELSQDTGESRQTPWSGLSKK